MEYISQYKNNLAKKNTVRNSILSTHSEFYYCDDSLTMTSVDVKKCQSSGWPGSSSWKHFLSYKKTSYAKHELLIL